MPARQCRRGGIEVRELPDNDAGRVVGESATASGSYDRPKQLPLMEEFEPHDRTAVMIGFNYHV